MIKYNIMKGIDIVQFPSPNVTIDKSSLKITAYQLRNHYRLLLMSYN